MFFCLCANPLHYTAIFGRLVRKRTSRPKDLQKSYTFCCVWGKSVKIPAQQRVCGSAAASSSVFPPASKQEQACLCRLLSKLVRILLGFRLPSAETWYVCTCSHLMQRDCPIRIIITVNALKEGWDCPFAYILASLAKRKILFQILIRLRYKSHQFPVM